MAHVLLMRYQWPATAKRACSIYLVFSKQTLAQKIFDGHVGNLAVFLGMGQRRRVFLKLPLSFQKSKFGFSLFGGKERGTRMPAFPKRCIKEIFY